MLVLIVVGAATAFAAFVASYQKEVEAQQRIAQERSLESLRVLSASPTANLSGAGWTWMNFTVASMSIYPSTINEVSINGNPLRQYQVWALNLTSGHSQNITVEAGGVLTVQAREMFNLIVCFSDRQVDSSFYMPAPVIPLSDYIQVNLFTALENTFTRTFIPPSAIGIISTQATWNGSGYVQTPILDGTLSYQPGNETIIGWEWQIYPDNTTAHGAKVVAPLVTTTNGYVHHITLTVTNNDGFEGLTYLTYIS